jgi:hypothetical protein
LPGSTVFTYTFALLGSIICNRLYFYTKHLREVQRMYDKNDMDEESVKNYFLTHDRKSIISAWGMILGSLIIVLISFAYSKFYREDSIIGWIGFILAIFLSFLTLAEEVDDDSKVISSDKGQQDAETLISKTFITESDGNSNSKFFGNGDE